MSAKLVWLLIALGPTLLAAMLGLRATWRRSPSRWDDYRDIVALLEGCAAPVLVVATPLLVRGYGLADLFAGWLSASAVLLFYVTANGFSPDTGGTLSERMKGILTSSGRGLGVAGFLILGPSAIGSTIVYPSAQLFISLLWASYLGSMLVGFLVRNDFRARPLGQSELLSRVQEIAQRCGVSLQQVSVITRIPGHSQCVNAVAVYGTQIALTQGLISNLSRAEVDAVIEHEIGHIADERIWSLDQALHYGSYLLMLAMAFMAERHIPAMQSSWAPMRYVMWLAMFLIPEFLEKWYSRKHERTASENVGVATDPLSAISGLYKVSVLNHHSLSRPWWSRIMSTHPYADEEIRDIAGRAGLSPEQIEQCIKMADAEMLVNTGNRYDLPISDDAAQESVDGQPVTEPVSRPGRWDGWHVALLALLGAALVVAGTIALAFSFYGPAVGLTIVLGLAASGTTLALPIGLANRNRMRKLREQIRIRLTGQYGSDAVTNDLLVDVLLPDWEDRDQPWQGALLSISNGELTVLGETARLRVPLDTKLSAFRWADENSSGDGARMVTIAYLDAGNPRAMLVRVLGRPSGTGPRNWKQLEKHIKNMLTQAGVSLVPRGELVPSHRRKLRWSARVPIAAAVYLLILAVADFLARERSGSDLADQIILCVIATAIAGPALWAWVTGEYKPDDQGH
jgi:Zn-dependent protease with chaperone function